MSLLIKGGRIITAANERITFIGESLDVDADRVIDASGRYVLPGCVDPHTHLDMPFGSTTSSSMESSLPSQVAALRRARAFGQELLPAAARRPKS